MLIVPSPSDLGLQYEIDKDMLGKLLGYVTETLKEKNRLLP